MICQDQEHLQPEDVASYQHFLLFPQGPDGGHSLSIVKVCDCEVKSKIICKTYQSRSVGPVCLG